MSINNIVKKQPNITTNVENADAFVMDCDKALYSVAANFIFRNGSYYSEIDRIGELETLVDLNIKAGNVDYVYALIWFLGVVQGIRLAPTIMLSRLVYTDQIKDTNKYDVKTIVNDVFTRPDFIANSLAYYKYSTGSKSIGSIPDYYKSILRNKFSKYKALTLKKRKMKRRDIKLADLIKVLKPNPVDNNMSKLYKSIIENTSYSSLKIEKDSTGKVIKADSAVVVLSDNSTSKMDSIQYIVDNIEKIPLNELIKNMNNLPTDSYQKLFVRLISVLDDNNAMRFFNPFNLILLHRSDFKMGGNYNLHKLLDNVLYDYILSKFTFNVKNPIVLVDISGSMGFTDYEQRSINMAVKYLSLILPILLRDSDNLKYYNFDTRLWDDTTEMLDIIDIEARRSPNILAEKLINYYKPKLHNGTRLRDCTLRLTQENPECDGLFIFTDEVSWGDQNNITNMKDIIPPSLYNKTFVFNVDPTRTTSFCKTDDVTRVSGLDGKVMYLLNSLLNFKTFKEQMITMYQG